MKRSDDRILTTHVGSLVRPPEVIDLVRAGAEGNLRGSDVVAAATADVVARQAAVGVDVVSDGEFGKPNFAGYVSDRLTGFEARPPDPGQSAIGNWGRDRKAFREFYEQDSSAQAGGGGGAPVVCVGPISYVGQDAVQADIDNFKAALHGAAVEEAFIPAVAPGTIEDSAGMITTERSRSTSERSPTRCTRSTRRSSTRVLSSRSTTRASSSTMT